tara:strand:+ start:40 stop:231 length:192 start_codon:yes stop_codon:yes gene_type:complete
LKKIISIIKEGNINIVEKNLEINMKNKKPNIKKQNDTIIRKNESSKTFFTDSILAKTTKPTGV